MSEQKIQFPLQFEIIDLPDEGTDVSGELPYRAVDIEDTDRWTFSTPFTYSLHFSSINSGRDVLVQGTLSGKVQVICDRCEEPFDWNFSTKDICYTYENAFGTTIDLTNSIREDILLLFPQQFLCSEECRGLCTHCGQNLNHGSCSCDLREKERDEQDSPWAALNQLQSKS